MSKHYCANLYCWEPSLELDPTSDDFRGKLRQIYRYSPRPKPSEAMLKLVAALAQRYPDATGTNETVWSDGTLKDGVIGEFINIGIKWRGFDEVARVVRATANALGLHAYDPQRTAFYPAPGQN